MGNRAKRKEVAKLLREHKLGKLYHGNKKSAWAMLDLDTLLRKLRYKAGDVAHTCDALNHRVVRWDLRRLMLHHYRRGQGWVAGLGPFVAEDGFSTCGCPYNPDPALPREDIERYLSDMDPESTPYFFDLVKVQEALRRGDHVCDEVGILLPEFYRRHHGDTTL